MKSHKTLKFKTKYYVSVVSLLVPGELMTLRS